jgi:hypothetical protein
MLTAFGWRAEARSLQSFSQGQRRGYVDLEFHRSQ